MKKLELKFGSIKEMLTKDQMEKIGGGGSYTCYAIGTGNAYSVTAENCCQAQADCDHYAFSSAYTDLFPQGGDVPCGMQC
jgi:hypothetical protein